MLRSHATQHANRCRGRIELRELVSVDHLPVTRWRGVHRSRLKKEGGRAIHQWSVNNVRVTGDPTNIRHASKPIAGVNIEHMLHRQACSEQIASCCVHNALWFSCRARRIQHEERVFAVHHYRWQVRSLSHSKFIQPLVTSIDPRHINCPRALRNQHMFYAVAFFQSRIHNRLGRDSAATTTTLVRCHDNARAAVLNTVTERFRAETSKHNRVDSTDATASQHTDHRIRNHGHIYNDNITLFYAHRLKNACHLANAFKKFTETNLDIIARLIRLPNDSSVVGTFKCPAVYEVVRGIQLSFHKPRNVPTVEAPILHGLEWDEP